MPELREIAVQVERKIVELLDEKRNEKGLSEVQWGKIAYPDDKDPRRKIQSIRNKQSNGQPQRLRVQDLILLSKALGVDPARILTRAMDENNL
ncbi:hypothetical protein [Desulfovibrio sp. ZJ200]|uniref:hypothetical protein n=1 Tax=Desulfovibrio sp. ZJ200 TaxID=2709792 RepID=UPI0013EBEE15|nr:hypothetical protein [Desulfovibrio sp. ZJ200]